MRKIAIWNNYTCFSENRLFDPMSYGIGEDLGYPIILLKDTLEKKGFIVETLDMDDPENFDKIIFLDVPNPKTCCCDIEKIPIEKKYLILTECEMVYPANKSICLHKSYKKIFSYNDDFVRSYNYVKFHIPNKIKIPDNIVDFKEKKFSIMITGNKISNRKGELYSERIKLIKYMNLNHPNDFDLYGMGWDKKTLFIGSRISRLLHNFNFVTNISMPKLVCYKGSVDRKISVLKNYKYCFSYENNNIIPGGITEKFWDCLFAGCVPVYWGTPNIEKYIPSDVYIDRRDFVSDDRLYEYLKSIDEFIYNKYIDSILKYLRSKEVQVFSADSFVNTIIKELEI